MTTLNTTIANVRRILKDNPAKIQLGAAVTDTTTETMTLAANNVQRVQQHATLEHDDNSGEQRRVISIDSATQITAERGFNGSTAASSHLISTYCLLNPRFPFDEISLAITHALVTMWNEGVHTFDTLEVVSSTTDLVYNLPDAGLFEVLSVYQQPAGFNDPITLTDWSLNRTVRDTDLFAAGYSIYIGENLGIPGTDKYYLTTKKQILITTATANQELILHNLAAALLLEWESPRRLSGPTNQGDRTVTSGQFLTAANYFRETARRAISVERANLRAQNPHKRNWKYG